MGVYQQRRELFRVLEYAGPCAIWEGGPRPDVPVTIRWIPSHTSLADVGEGLITWLDREGNNAAGEKAK